jgi:hypothetical protein
MEDAQARAELHLKLCERYMREAEDLPAKGDYARASERAWGASSQMVKALAAGGEELRGHAGLWEYVDRLAEELGDIELRRLWRALAVLHRNFYGDWMPPQRGRTLGEGCRNSLGEVEGRREALAGRGEWLHVSKRAGASRGFINY